jgi:hypothetical protein
MLHLYINMEVPVWNYVIAMIVLIVLISFSIYGLYWEAANISHNGGTGGTGGTGFTGCTGTGYTGTIIINSIDTETPEEYQPIRFKLRSQRRIKKENRSKTSNYHG